MAVLKLAEKRSLAARVKELRTERKWSITVLSEKCGVNLSSISAIESGNRPNPGADTLIALATAFRIPLDELLGFDHTALPPESRIPTTIEGVVAELEALRERIDVLEGRKRG